MDGLFELVDAIGTVVRPDWMADAVCVDEADPDIFFDQWKVIEAKTACLRCPVQDSCRTYALNRLIVDGVAEEGVWGGTTLEERKRAVGVGHSRNADLDAEIMRLVGMGMSESKIASVVAVSSRQVQRVKAKAKARLAA
ncbi:WhiB family transcriptional regulator [Amycolatopsis sp. NPDC051373]|uniref:WhiB family transcriptional regulator n=1 Tax=Amycolatopsis sp. NPDC051373 TaxID=3155801 RepID=UPI00344D28CF